ncbi:MAG: phenylalanine--tRNA ligase subunit beta [Acidimicrobiia bacterium]|nr:phenylalanine--tRNA ligase subunit beta [Acidimicrobiia bacterium]
MKLTLNWLREFVDLPEEPSEIAAALASLGFKAESIENLPLEFSGVMVAKATEVRPHPDADRIRIVDIETGSADVTVVCGAWNFEAGAVVAYAPPGSVLAGGLAVGEKAIRGINSPGMIASERELGLSDEHAGILVLDDATPLGSDLADLVGLPDVAFDLEVNANRPDCMSVVGIARELAAFFGRELRYEEIELPAEAGGPSVTVGDGCGRFVARRVHGITIGSSPLAVQTRLRAAGVRPISNVVDATNYAMLELGHPTHVFDADALGDTIVVRLANPGETLRTLDGVDRTLDAADIVVADATTARAIGGVMGGEDSEVGPATTDVIVEAAYFHPGSVMRTATRHGLRSEASARFQRGMDPNAARRAADRVAQLLVANAGGTAGGLTDAYPTPVAPQQIDLTLSEIERVTGKGFSADEVRAILEPLGFELGGSEPLRVTVPTRRVDVSREIDFVEEVARFHGYDNFGSRAAVGPGYGLPVAERRYRRLRESMVSAGYFETTSFSFIGQVDLDGLGLPPDDARRSGIRVTNPLRAEESVMRTTLLPGLLKAAAGNLSRRIDSVALFETGKVFLPGDEIPDQPESLGFVAVGLTDEGWFGEGRHRDVMDAMGVVQRLATDMGVPDLELQAASPPAMHPGRTAEVLVAGEVIGVIGELHPRVAAAFDIEGRVAAGELRIDALLREQPAFIVTEASPYPPVIFDLAFDLPDAAVAASVLATALSAAPELIERIDLFDVFRGAPLEDGRKSLAMRVIMRAVDRTLTDDEVTPAREAMSDKVAAVHDGRLRSG